MPEKAQPTSQDSVLALTSELGQLRLSHGKGQPEQSASAIAGSRIEALPFDVLRAIATEQHILASLARTSRSLHAELAPLMRAWSELCYICKFGNAANCLVCRLQQQPRSSVKRVSASAPDSGAVAAVTAAADAATWCALVIEELARQRRGAARSRAPSTAVGVPAARVPRATKFPALHLRQPAFSDSSDSSDYDCATDP